MKIVMATVGGIFIFILFMILFESMSGTTAHHQTDYQACMETAKQLRSDIDTKSMERMCDMLPVDPRDMR